MSYGTPYESGQRKYTVVLTSATNVDNGDYPLIITCIASTDNINSSDVATKFQQFVDFLGDGGSNFNVISATRVKEFTEDISATP